jgi:hypothetical protein
VIAGSDPFGPADEAPTARDATWSADATPLEPEFLGPDAFESKDRVQGSLIAPDPEASRPDLVAGEPGLAAASESRAVVTEVEPDDLTFIEHDAHSTSEGARPRLEAFADIDRMPVREKLLAFT